MSKGREVLGGLFVAGGALLAIAAGGLALAQRGDGEAPGGLALLVVAAAGAVVFTAIGVARLLGSQRRQAGAEEAPADYRHTVPLFALIGVLLGAALVARAYVTPDTFGDHGHYRGAAVAEARTVREPRHVGVAKCATCHEDVAQLRAKDVHRHVECEACHGAAARHAEAPSDVAPPIPQGNDTCLACHLRVKARPGAFPQIEPAEHFATIGVADPKTACIRCHDPHEPLFLDRDLEQARLHPVIHRCRDCHIGRTDEKMERPEGHQPIFQCDYCHAAIAADFAGRTHREVPCARCHLFIPVSESAGRIVRDADPRFCLLCHRKADFRSGKVPGIEWPEHRDDMSTDAADATKRCVDCHMDHIHQAPGGAK